MKKIFIMLCMAIQFIACTKEEPFIGHGCDDEVFSESGSHQQRPLINTSSTSLLTTNPTGQMSSVTPIAGIWNIKQQYLDTYQHFYQIDASPEYPGKTLCGPTSYMLAAHMIVSAKGGIYPSSKAKVGAIYSKLSQAGKFDDAVGMYISDIPWFCATYDYPVVKTSSLRTSSRDAMKEYIEFYIKSGYPVIVTINIFGLQGAYWGNDLDMTDQSGVKYYVSKNGPVGHFVVLTGIKINADGSGRIWYKDPLSKTNDTRCASYTRILDAMKYNGNNDYYDAVAVFDGSQAFSYQLLEFFLRSFLFSE